MPREVVEIQITRQGNQHWGFRLVGGSDTGLVLKVEKVRTDIISIIYSAISAGFGSEYSSLSGWLARGGCVGECAA